jgi:response regulator RpfG family c-di-GMP phosphodiesterase
MNKNKRILLIILVSAIQLVMMLSGVVLLFSQIKDRTAEWVTYQIFENIDVLACQVTGRIKSMELEDIRSETPDFERLQRYVERSAFPGEGEGFVAIIDEESGKFLSHPNLRQFPELRKTSWESMVNCGISRLQTKDTPSVVMQLKENPMLPSAVGVALIDGSQFIVSAQRLPELGAVALVGQRVSEAGLMGHLLIDSLQRLAFAVVLAVGLFGTVVSFLVVKRNEDNYFRSQLQLEQQVVSRTEELVNTRNAVIFGLAKLAESRDNDTGEHLDRIRKYVTILAKELSRTQPEIDDEFIDNLSFASSLHDIGKVGIPDSILLKSGPLTPDERNIMEMHTVIGGECLEAIGGRLGENNFLEIAREVTYWHHEHWDGTGYPHKLSEFAIPIAARIVAVADVYDALTSRRPYKKPLAHHESRAIILSGSGSQFDPEVVAAFLRHEGDFHRIALQHQDHFDEDRLATAFDGSQYRNGNEVDSATYGGAIVPIA